MDAIPVLVFWALAAYALVGRTSVLPYLFFGSIPFGAFAVVPPEMIAGLTLTPTPMFVLIIILRALGNMAGLRFFAESALSPQRLLLLFLFWLVAIFVTLFMPRLFYGETNIIPMRRLLPTLGIPLEPGTQNFSQLAYLSISVFAVFAFARLLRRPAMQQVTLKAMCLGAALVVLTGFLDYASFYIPLDPLLSPFRTASYSLMTDVEIFSGKRVVGLMPEASTYGSLCIIFLGLMYFLRHAMVDRMLRRRVAPTLAVLLLVCLWLSTSSSAYVGLAIFGLVALAEWTWRKSTRFVGSFGHRGLGYEFWGALAGIFALGLVIIVNPAMFDPVIDVIDELIFNKVNTSSYEERNMWTAVSWKALLDTWGLGVGMGSTRASNAAVAVFSNTGVLGGLLYFGFLLHTFVRKLPATADGVSRSLQVGIRCAFLPSFIVGLLAGTSADFGSMNAFLFGATWAVTIRCRHLHRSLVEQELRQATQVRAYVYQRSA